MSKGHSIHAQRALEQLKDSYFINWFIRSDASRVDASCPPGHSNHTYNATLESYLGRLQVCHAADILNSYCQSILGEILTSNLAYWELVKKFFQKRSDTKLEPDVLRRRLFDRRAPDRETRLALRKGIKSYWSPESDVILKLRNKFVHQDGHDPMRVVESEIRRKGNQWCPIPPPDIQHGVIPVRYSSDHWLEADLELGTWASAHVRAHIDFMDQNLCTRFDLPRNLWRPRSIKRKYGSANPNAKPQAPQTSQSLQMSDSGENLEADPVEPPPMTTQPTQKEIECAQFMRETVVSFVQSGMEYAKKINAYLVRADSGSYGMLLNHTIRGHDLGYEMEFKPSEHDEEKSELVCFRARESDFDPFMTIWGTSSMMKDFQKADIPEKAKRYLEECIEKTFTCSRY